VRDRLLASMARPCRPQGEFGRFASAPGFPRTYDNGAAGWFWVMMCGTAMEEARA
jgi:hypothetical protein